MPLDLSRDVAIRWSDPDPKHAPLLKECGANTVILETPSPAFAAAFQSAGLRTALANEIQFLGLEEMEHAPKHEVEELMEFAEDTAGGLMNTEYVALRDDATVADALTALQKNEDLLETLNTLFLIDEQERLVASVPLARLFLHQGGTLLRSLATETLIQVPVGERQDRVTELFDKYNLLALPVTGEDLKLAGVITADDIISVLRQKR